MENTIIIRLYDYSMPDFFYPLLEIYKTKRLLFYMILKKHKRRVEYNLEDFILELNKKGVLKREILADETTSF